MSTGQLCTAAVLHRLAQVPGCFHPRVLPHQQLLAVQWLTTARGKGLILVQGTKILHAVWLHQKTNKQTKQLLFPSSLKNQTSVLKVTPSHGGRKTHSKSQQVCLPITSYRSIERRKNTLEQYRERAKERGADMLGSLFSPIPHQSRFTPPELNSQYFQVTSSGYRQPHKRPDLI